MKNIIKKLVKENLNNLMVEGYDSEKLYSRDYVVNILKRGPGYMRKFIKSLPSIECEDANGSKKICTKIPEVIYNLINNNF